MIPASMMVTFTTCMCAVCFSMERSSGLAVSIFFRRRAFMNRWPKYSIKNETKMPAMVMAAAVPS